jgi:hypothetical protein
MIEKGHGVPSNPYVGHQVRGASVVGGLSMEVEVFLETLPLPFAQSPRRRACSLIRPGACQGDYFSPG